MPPVSNIDRLVLILRQKLSARRRPDSGGPTRRSAGRSPSGIAGVRALAAVGDVDEGALRRSLIQAILIDELGGQSVNDARFQQIVERVTEALEQDAGGSGLLDRVLADLRADAP